MVGFVVVLGSAPCMAEVACSARSGRSVVPLVELYTSEGCSSCPPADRWFSAQAGRTDANWLAFHVDYWDYIGWPDRFASAGNSARQRKRVNAAGEETVFTPQVMVGEQTRASWNSISAFDAVLRAARGDARLELDLALTASKGGWEIEVGSSKAETTDTNIQVWLARTLDGQSTDVKRGENRGSTLNHDAIVRQVWGPWTPPVRQTIRIDGPDSDEANWSFVAFAQDGNGKTLQSLALRENSCAEAAP